MARSDDLGAHWTVLPDQPEFALWSMVYIGDDTLIGQCSKFQPFGAGFSDANIPQLFWCVSTDNGETWHDSALTIDAVQTDAILYDSNRAITTPSFIQFWPISPIAWNQHGAEERVLLVSGRLVQTRQGYEPVDQILERGLYRSTNGIDWHVVFSGEQAEAYSVNISAGWKGVDVQFIERVPVRRCRTDLANDDRASSSLRFGRLELDCSADQ